MKCPHCGAPSEVLETRPFRGAFLRRTRLCFNEHKFKTYELHAQENQMNLYRVIRSDINGDHEVLTKWAGSQAEVVSIKKEWMAEGTKRKEISVKEVVVPTNKSGLIAWLNGAETEHLDDCLPQRENAQID